MRAQIVPLLSLNLLFLAGCASHPPLATPDRVDLDRFMGTWFVVGYTPILVDKEAYNAVEHYHNEGDGTIRTTYQFRKGGFDGDLKTYTPVGTIHDRESNAEWRMQFIWPFKAQYIIHYLSPDYQRTIIAHPNRKYAWIMQRQPEISDTDYEAMLSRLEAAGFDPAIIERVPHDWSREPERYETMTSIGDSRPLAR
jgi:apolipoprotein D and lipocalin family protein